MTTLTYPQVYALARGQGLTHDQAVTATAIAKAESGLRTSAAGDTTITTATWGPSVGLWQIRSLTAEHGTGRSRDATRLTDPAFNARSMASISGGGRSWGPWSVYTSSAYLAYLPDVRRAVGAPGAVDAPPAGTSATFPPPWKAEPAGLDLNPLDDVGGTVVRALLATIGPLVLPAAAVVLGMLLVGVGVHATTRGGAT